MGEDYVTINLEAIDNSCFVVMPFHSLYETEYEQVIKPAVEELGFKCIRGDEIYSQQSIVNDIWRSIRRSRVIIAELSDRNPNVMYEIGLAHALGKPIILLTRNENDVPFDLRSLRYIRYDTSDPFWGKNLLSKLKGHLEKLLDPESSSVHLPCIDVFARMPEMPVRSRRESKAVIQHDLSGIWHTHWLSIKTERRHDATLIIQNGHGSHFTASLTVRYKRENQLTVVEESLDGLLNGNNLKLTGVNYSYLERGASSRYGLDNFELIISKDMKELKGKAILSKGVRSITFRKGIES